MNTHCIARDPNLPQETDVYFTDEHGVIHQMGRATVAYDAQYVAKYDDLHLKSRAMSYLRLGYITGIIGAQRPGSVLDIGYGNGDFLRAAANAGLVASGFDISGVDLNDARIHTSSKPDALFARADLITFFDSFEHFPELGFLNSLNTEFLAISVPWCHWDMRETAFASWKHRKPGEHLHHFGPNQLKSFFRAQGWNYLHHSNIEDSIRGPLADGTENILTALFAKAKRL